MGLLLCKWLIFLHPFYLSVTEIRHNADHKTLEISCRIFADDLENTLKKQSHTTFDIIKPQNRATVDSLISRYIAKHLQITVDGKVLAPRYLGYKIEEEAAWCFLEVSGVATVKKLDLKDDILYEQHESQSHMIHVIVHDKRQSTKLDNPKANASFGF
ncbi:hypothetical protein GFS24_12945 [Chitinophaga sp. SYP-B3965]|uniref:DUF6702 family protein n=1 Tax=Chitinophaga sp. SYP-B3965 TaxID=2663120 RepID=UPI00129A0413|nr:DUF6702 family protein [Chitinophaga sp. SYP-B3965]MRG46028.1 hypothetical protein [Chitinophaga sp. SYP-B3965]